jgi:hypothetical protein
MITFELVLFTLFIFIMVYALVDRVCKCLETRAMAKAFFASAGKGMMGNPAEAIAKLNAALNSKSKDA